MENKNKNEQPPKIRIGRLAIDAVFFVLALFSIFSVVLLGLILWYAS